MKQLTILFFALMLSLPMVGQTKLSAEQQKPVLEKIDKAAKVMKSMQCDFLQTKTMKMLKRDMVSKGVMYFKHPNQLRWQYTSPYDYIFIMNGEKVQMKSLKSTQELKVEGNKMFRQITNIILNSITGGSLRNSADFTVEIYQSGKLHFARLYPKKKELKQLYQYIEIHFNQALTMVSTVKMIEKTGDITVVQLQNVKTNTAINAQLFDIR